MTDARPTILFVGESPPAGAPPDFRPFDCASGSRLAKAIGLVDREALLAHVPFTNVFPTPTGIKGHPAWDARLAGEVGRALRREPARRTLVGVGRRPTEALCGWGDVAPMTWSRLEEDGRAFDVLSIPHPSGQSQALNTEESRRELRRAVLPDLLAATNVSLRPWHFRLDEPAVLADLGLALCPLDPAFGAAAAVICAEVWRAKVAPASVTMDDYKSRVDVGMWFVGHLARRGLGGVVLALCPNGVPSKSFAAEVRSRHKFCARTLPRPPSAEVRAAYARLVVLGVA